MPSPSFANLRATSIALKLSALLWDEKILWMS